MTIVIYRCYLLYKIDRTYNFIIKQRVNENTRMREPQLVYAYKIICHGDLRR